MDTSKGCRKRVLEYLEYARWTAVCGKRRHAGSVIVAVGLDRRQHIEGKSDNKFEGTTLGHTNIVGLKI